MDGASDLEDPREGLLQDEDSPEGEDNHPGDEDGDEEGAEDEDSFVRLSRCTRSPGAVPWGQRSAKMRLLYLADRAFLGFLALFLLVLALEILYKAAYLLPWRALYEALEGWMLAQEEDEEALEL
ncbi:small integral membrane protein 40 [Lissotriton helveticus]